MRSFIARTSKLDNVTAAVEEVLSQIDSSKLQAHTVGIITCHYEFALTDTIKAISDALPFNIVGITSSAQTPNGFELSLLVLTADDAVFVTALTEPLVGNPEGAIGAAYTDAVAHFAQSVDANMEPKLILLHTPYIVMNNGDNYLSTLSSLSNSTPVFGAFSLDDTDNFEYCYSIYNGEIYKDRMALVIGFGNIKPRFYVANISPDKIVGKPALITKSNEQILYELNNRPFAEYMAELGLAQSIEQQYAMSSLPFLLDYQDGSPEVSRVFIMLTPDGAAMLNGTAPEGLNLRVGSFDKDDVLETADAVLHYVLGDVRYKDGAVRGAYAAQQDDGGCEQPQALLIYSCFARNMALGLDDMAEIELVQDIVGSTVPYLFNYVGGEFCPTKTADKKAANRFHNNAFIVCAL